MNDINDIIVPSTLRAVKPFLLETLKYLRYNYTIKYNIITSTNNFFINVYDMIYDMIKVNQQIRAGFISIQKDRLVMY